MGFWQGKDLVTARGLPRNAVEELFAEAEEMRAAVSTDAVPQCLMRKSVALLFFEPSLRSNLFLASAVNRLGGSTLNYSQSQGFEVFKGERFSNAIRLASATVDVVAVRHPMAGAAAVAAEASGVPVLNCGDGSNQHPLNALSYLFEVKREKKEIDGLHFVFIGDLAGSRTVHSLLSLLTKFEDVSISLHSDGDGRVPAWLLNELRDSAKVRENNSLELQNADVVYVTRSKAEPFLTQEQVRALPEKTMLLRQRKSSENFLEYALNSVALRMAVLKKIKA